MPNQRLGWLHFAWNSPTITTWASFAGRFLSLLLVLPLALRHLSAAEIAVWQLFSNVLLIGVILDLGLSPTLSRVISLTLGGTRLAALAQPATKNTTSVESNENVRWATVAVLLKAGRTMYAGLAICALLLLGSVGSLALMAPISAVASPDRAWIAWLVVLSISSLGVWGNLYSSYLMGVNRVAVLRRWQALAAIAQVLTAALVLFLGGGLLELVISNQVWLAASYACNAWLCRKVIPGRFQPGWQLRIPPLVLQATWPPMWRSGVGVMASLGVMSASGFIYAQWADSQELAAFLLAQRVMLAISQFSQAPFYSKLPAFARLYAEDHLSELMANAQRAMRMSYWVLVVGVISAGVLLPLLMIQIGSKTAFVSPSFWAIYGIAVFVERLGAMHMQLFSLSNRILWHIANGLTGLVFVALMVGLYEPVGTIAFPIAMLVSYAAIYSLFSIRQSYLHFGLTLEFERRSSMVPALTMLVILVVFVLLSPSYL